MNFLAHTYLSCGSEDLLIGNFLADFLRNKEIENLPDCFLNGIHLHRKIDTFTDNHPRVSEVNKMFHAEHGKYAPVVTDVLFDYILAKNWSKYSGEDIDDFISRIYELLNKNVQYFPERRKEYIMKMIKGDFLTNYTKIEGLRFTFEKMDSQTRFPSNFVSALGNLEEKMPFLDLKFNAFFPELIEEVDSFCSC